MKITNLFSSTNLYNKSSVNEKKLEQTKKFKDSFSLSDKARDFQNVLKALSNVPDIREDKVNSLLKNFQQGDYNVSAEDIANKLVK